MSDLKDTVVHEENGTFLTTFQKHCGGRLFLVGILLYTIGNVLTMLLGHGLLGIFPLLFLVLPVTGLFLGYFESRRRRAEKNTLRILKFFKVLTIVLLVVLCVEVPFAINNLFRGGNFVALSAFYSLVFSVPLILYLVSLWRVVNGLSQGVRDNERGKLRGVLPVTIFGVIAIILELLHVGLFTGSAQTMLFYIIWWTQGIAHFGIQPGAGILFDFVSGAGGLMLIVVLNLFNRDLVRSK